jgi:hypothetical protein
MLGPADLRHSESYGKSPSVFMHAAFVLPLSLIIIHRTISGHAF